MSAAIDMQARPGETTKFSRRMFFILVAGWVCALLCKFAGEASLIDGWFEGLACLGTASVVGVLLVRCAWQAFDSLTVRSVVAVIAVSLVTLTGSGVVGQLEAYEALPFVGQNGTLKKSFSMYMLAIATGAMAYLWHLSLGSFDRLQLELEGRVRSSRSELAERKRAEGILHTLAEGTSGVVGAEFFASLVRQLVITFKVRCAVVTERLAPESTSLQTLAVCIEDDIAENFTFDAAGGPCELTMSGNPSFFAKSVCEEFPDVDTLQSLRAESYYGLPLFASNGDVIGHVAIIDDKEMPASLATEPALRIFAARAAAELQRIRTEHALRQSEQRLQTVVSSAPIVITSINKDHTIDLFDGNGLCSVGLKPGQFNGEDYFELWKGEKDLTSSVRAAFSGDASEPVTHTVGHTRMETRCSAITDSSGDVTGVIAVCVDVTDREKAEDVLRAIAFGTSRHVGLDFFASLVEHVTKALEVRYCLVTERLDQPPNRHRTLAFWTGDRLGGNFEHDLTGADSSAAKAAFRPTNIQTLLPDDADLAGVDEACSLAIPLLDARGSVIGHLVVLDDKRLHSNLRNLPALQIFAARAAAELERKRTEEAMKERDRSLRLTQFAVDKASAAVFWIRRDQTLLYANNTACRWLGYGADELLSKSIGDIDSTYSRADDWGNVWSKLQHERSLTMESVYKRKDGTSFPVEFTGNYLEFEQEEYLCAYVRDTSELKESQDKSRQLLADLAHVSRLRTLGEMVTGIAHEINQPLAAIGNFADAAVAIVGSDKPLDTDHLANLLCRIEEQSFQAGEIIRHLRDLAKRSEPDRTLVDIQELVDEVVALTSNELALSSINLTMCPTEEVRTRVEADRIQVQQVMVNLVRNAIDTLLEQGPQQRELAIDLQSRRESIEFIVTDNGPGIARNDAERVFDAFYTTKADGMGMGLAISKSIIEAHSGRMWHSVCPNGKTRFHFTLPRTGKDEPVAIGEV